MMMIAILYFITLTLGYVTNLKPINRDNGETSPAYGMSKNPQTLQFSGSKVCDKYATILQYGNNSDFPVDFNMYIQDNFNNYTVDVYFKNLDGRNDFTFFNVTDKSELSTFNPVLVSTQQKGIEVKLNMAKGLLCQFLYKFTVAYQLSSNTTSSDKIFMVGSCQLNEKFYPDEYNDYIAKGFKCIDYNSDFKYDGGQDWCNIQYESSQCCETFKNDVLVDRECQASTLSSLYSVTTPVMHEGTAAPVASASSSEVEPVSSSEPSSGPSALTGGQSEPGPVGPMQQQQQQQQQQ